MVCLTGLAVDLADFRQSNLASMEGCLPPLRTEVDVIYVVFAARCLMHQVKNSFRGSHVSLQINL